jgi:hypothetical protein
VIDRREQQEGGDRDVDPQVEEVGRAAVLPRSRRPTQVGDGHRQGDGPGKQEDRDRLGEVGGADPEVPAPEAREGTGAIGVFRLHCDVDARRCRRRLRVGAGRLG